LIVAEEFAAAALIASPNRGRVPLKPSATPAAVERRSQDHIWHQFRRERQIDGRDVILGTLRTSFVCGQRTAIEHLVFCPMFDATPTVRAIATATPDCTVKATHVYRYGARLEIKLAEPCDESVELVISYEIKGTGVI
jgi:hypothetical protein